MGKSVKEGVMPKEIIYGRYHGTDEDPEPEVRLGWSKEAGHVELATINVDGQVLHPTPEGNGWFVALDRYGINRLIKCLRQARDDAFGRDE